MKAKKTVVNLVVCALILCGICWIASLFIHIGGQWTDNAQIRRDMVQVSARVQGYVEEIRFADFQHVRQGDTLVIIENSEYRLRLVQAEADYQNAMAGKDAMNTGISTTSNNLLVTAAAMDEVRVQLRNAEADYNRFTTLYAANAVTKQQLDGVTTQYESLKARLATMERQKQTTSLVRSEQREHLRQAEGGVDICQANLDIARLHLSYTYILAPCDGVISGKRIQVGELLNPGMPVFTVVSDEAPWVIANFRETQMQDVQPGCKARIVVDAFPDSELTGTVVSVSNATGAQYNPMSGDNAIGNFVKIEQRIPVKVQFDADCDADLLSRLSSGMNVECTVQY